MPGRSLVIDASANRREDRRSERRYRAAPRRHIGMGDRPLPRDFGDPSPWGRASPWLTNVSSRHFPELRSCVGCWRPPSAGPVRWRPRSRRPPPQPRRILVPSRPAHHGSDDRPRFGATAGGAPLSGGEQSPAVVVVPALSVAVAFLIGFGAVAARLSGDRRELGEVLRDVATLEGVRHGRRTRHRAAECRGFTYVRANRQGSGSQREAQRSVGRTPACLQAPGATRRVRPGHGAVTGCPPNASGSRRASWRPQRRRGGTIEIGGSVPAGPDREPVHAHQTGTSFCTTRRARHSVG